MATSTPAKPMGNPNWVKGGPTPNPRGRPKRKPITSVILAALNKPLRRGDRRTMAEAFKDRLADIIMKGEDQHSLAALKLLLAYIEGQPQQTVRIDYERALDEVSARTGAPKLWLIKRSEEIALRHAVEYQGEGDYDNFPGGHYPGYGTDDDGDGYDEAGVSEEGDGSSRERTTVRGGVAGYSIPGRISGRPKVREDRASR